MLLLHKLKDCLIRFKFLIYNILTLLTSLRIYKKNSLNKKFEFKNWKLNRIVWETSARMNNWIWKPHYLKDMRWRVQFKVWEKEPRLKEKLRKNFQKKIVFWMKNHLTSKEKIEFFLMKLKEPEAIEFKFRKCWKEIWTNYKEKMANWKLHKSSYRKLCNYKTEL